MIHDVEAAIRAYLPQIIHLSLVTSSKGRPWVCELHFAYDDDLNLYFRSKPSRRHSQEIALNPHVAGNIVTQHGVEEKPRGVSFEGEATMLENVDATHPAYRTLSARHGLDASILEDARQEDGHKFYMIRVSQYYLFDGRDSHPGQKYELPWPRT